MTKKFELELDYGPYMHSYTRNGRDLLLGGSRGHISLIDWHKCTLKTELFLDDKVTDVCTLFDNTMFAVAQRRKVYIYDSDGVEIHCLKDHVLPCKLTFLPHHFLLCSVGRKGILNYRDISTGEPIASLNTRFGLCKVMRDNPFNAVMHLGHMNGVVTLWSPKVSDALAKIRCHSGPLTSISFDSTGKYMVSTGADGFFKVWDIRKFKKEVSVRRNLSVCNTVDVSQKDVLAVANGPRVFLWRNPFTKSFGKPDMNRLFPGSRITRTAFCPFEDALGISTQNGFKSVPIRGSGEQNFDVFDVNPFENRHEKRERLVGNLLDKIQPELITLDPNEIGRVNKINEN